MHRIPSPHTTLPALIGVCILSLFLGALAALAHAAEPAGGAVTTIEERSLLARPTEIGARRS
jgi:hypothetical protein